MTDLLVLLSPQNIIVYMLIMARLAGMIISAPLFSTYPIPVQFKATLVALVAFMMYPMVLHHINIPMPTNMIALSVLVLKELSVGILIGFCVELIFVSIQLAGHFLSMQVGLSVSNILDPTTRQQVPVLGQIYMFLATIIFLYINGHQWLFTSVYDSYNAIPIDYHFIFSGKVVEQIIYLLGQMFNISFGIIIPIFGVLFIADICMGFISKVMPQMNIFMVAMPLKIYVGIALMIFFLPSTAVYMSSLIKNLLDNISSIFT